MVSVSHYFEKRRALATGITVSGAGVGKGEASSNRTFSDLNLGEQLQCQTRIIELPDSFKFCQIG